MRVFPVKDADPGRTVELVAGEGVKIAVDIAHVDVEMHRRLRAVDQHRNAVRVGDARDFLHWHQGAEHVRHMGDGDELGAWADQLLELVDEKMPLLVDRRPFDHCALAFAQEMPGHDVGVMLHDREHDLVARLDALAAEGVGDKVDRLGGITRKDDLLLAAGIEERRHLLPRALVGFGRLVGEVMQPAMHVGILRGVGLVQAIEHRLRLLRRGGVVEIDERLAVNLGGENGEIRADTVHVIGAVGDRRMHHEPRALSQAATASVNTSRKPACSMPSTASPRKAWMSNASASAAGMPRAIR